MTTRAQPETIFRELFEGVIGVLVHGHLVGELQLKRWERDADALARVSRGEGYEVKAYLAAIQGDDAESDKLYDAALKVTNDYVSTVIRYLTLLSNRLRPEKFLEVYRAVGDCRKGDPSATRFVENLLAMQGFMISAAELSEELERMNSHSCGVPRHPSEAATQGTGLGDYSDEDFAKPVAFAKRFVAAKGVLSRGYTVGPQAREGVETSVFFQMHTDQTPQEASELEWELFEALAEEAFPVEVEGKLSFALCGTRAELS